MVTKLEIMIFIEIVVHKIDILIFIEVYGFRKCVDN